MQTIKQVMSSEYSNSNGRRSSRRGGGSRRPGGRSNHSSGPRSSRQETPSKPQKKSLWQKIAAFFAGNETTKPAAAPARSRESSDSAESSAPRRAERTERPGRPTGFRKPEIIEVTSPRIYVGNLSFDATESDLSDLFNGVGSVENVEIVANKHTQRSKGFAFVQMQSTDEAKRAVTELHDKEYMGRKLVVSGAKAVEERRSERERQPEQ